MPMPMTSEAAIDHCCDPTRCRPGGRRCRMSSHGVGQPIDHRLPALGEAGRSRRPDRHVDPTAAATSQPGPAEAVVLERAVPHGAPDRPARQPPGTAPRPSTPATPWWISYAATGARATRRPVGRSTLSAPKVTVVGSRPSPAPSPAPDSTSSSIVRPASGSRRRSPAPAAPRAARPTTASASPSGAATPGRQPWTGAGQHDEVGVGDHGGVGGDGDLARPARRPARRRRWRWRSAGSARPPPAACAGRRRGVESRRQRRPPARPRRPATRRAATAARRAPAPRSARQLRSRPGASRPTSPRNLLITNPRSAPGRPRRAAPRCRTARRTRRRGRCRRPPRPAARTAAPGPC